MLFKLLVSAVFLTSVTECTGVQNPGLSELLSNPTRYNGRQITVEGYYFDSFEYIAMSKRLEKTGQGYFTPAGERIWIDGGLTQLTHARNLHRLGDVPDRL